MPKARIKKELSDRQESITKKELKKAYNTSREAKKLEEKGLKEKSLKKWRKLLLKSSMRIKIVNF